MDFETSRQTDGRQEQMISRTDRIFLFSNAQNPDRRTEDLPPGGQRTEGEAGLPPPSSVEHTNTWWILKIISHTPPCFCVSMSLELYLLP